MYKFISAQWTPLTGFVTTFSILCSDYRSDANSFFVPAITVPTLRMMLLNELHWRTALLAIWLLFASRAPSREPIYFQRSFFATHMQHVWAQQPKLLLLLFQRPPILPFNACFSFVIYHRSLKAMNTNLPFICPLILPSLQILQIRKTDVE